MLCIQFLHLQQDYEYNLELLDGRDAELERYDKEFDAIRQELAAREHLISQLRTALAKAESGIEIKLPCHALFISETHVAQQHPTQSYSAVLPFSCLLPDSPNISSSSS